MTAPATTLPSDPPTPVLHVVDETDGYTSAVAGVTVEGARVGRGVGPNVVLAVPDEVVTVTSTRYGFPMTNGAHIPDDKMLVAFVHDNPGGSRWCGLPVEGGSVIVYPPGAEHVAMNHPGLHFTFAIVDQERLAGHAGRLGMPADLPTRPRLHEIPPSAAAERLGMALNTLTGAVLDDRPHHRCREPVLTALAESLGGDPPAKRHESRRGVDSQRIVARCIEFAEQNDRIPTLAELCSSAFVSERRLRSAFTEEFDQPPMRFFRTWALDRAHRRLRRAGPADSSVTHIATTLGFDHLGRFAGRYRSVYGESPSHTLSRRTGD